MHAIVHRFAFTTVGALALSWLPQTAAADVVTGTVTPQDAKVVIVNASGAPVAQLKAGPYQLQLPVGRYKARCEAPKPREQDFLSLSEPVTVNIDCK
jgi:phosphate-selective porin